MSKTDCIIRYKGPTLIGWLIANHPERLNEDQTAVLGLTRRKPAQEVVLEGETWLWQFARVRGEDYAFWEGVAGTPASSLVIERAVPRVQGHSDVVYQTIWDEGEAEGVSPEAVARLDRLKLMTYVTPVPILDEEGQDTGETTAARYDRPCYM